MDKIRTILTSPTNSWKERRQNANLLPTLKNATAFNSFLNAVFMLQSGASVQFCSAAQSCLTLCDPMDWSTLGLPVHHPLLEFTQVHWVGDAIQPSHPLSSPSPLAFNLSQHQGLSNESVLHIRWPKHWSFSFSISPSNEYSGLISFRMDWFDLLAVPGILKSLLQYHSSKASILWRSASFIFSTFNSAHLYSAQRGLVAYSPWGCKESDTTVRPSTAQHIHPFILSLSGHLVSGKGGTTPGDWPGGHPGGHPPGAHFPTWSPTLPSPLILTFNRKLVITF